MALRELHLFAGAGGGILGGILLGHVPVCAVELEEYPRKVLLQRQRDGILPWFPIWDDVCTFDGTNWKGKVDVVCGGFPCQDLSSAGKGEGLKGERSGLFFELARIVREIRPQYVFLENSPMLVSRGLEIVLDEFASMGYDAQWGIIGARGCGGPIERERIWITCSDKIDGEERLGNIQQKGAVFKRVRGECPDFWLQAPSKCFGMEHGLDSYLDQVSAIGNGQVPQVASLAWRILGGV